VQKDTEGWTEGVWVCVCVCVCVCVYEDIIMKPTTVWKRQLEGKEEWENKGELNLFKVHYTHVSNYHNEIPWCMMTKKIFKNCVQPDSQDTS
jgi:hypothetical protein